MILLAALLAAAPVAPDIWLIEGSYPPDAGPDGNTVIVDAPEGLIVVDTGRHDAHREKIEAFAAARGKPIAAIVNTHWHLDHVTGNIALKAASPALRVYAGNGIDGALKGFLETSAERSRARLADPKLTAAERAQIGRGLATIEAGDKLRPDVVIDRSETVTIAGRTLDIRLAPYAASESDVWIKTGDTVIAGDLVVGMTPFMDTACAEGWRRALDAIAATDFVTLVPGHGGPMSKAGFLTWRAAFNALLDCAASDAPKSDCVNGWLRDAAAFIPQDEARAPAMIAYYIDTRLRAAPSERGRYCAPETSD